jgi:hypothetical protein
MEYEEQWADRQVSANSHSLVNKVRNVAVTLLDNEIVPGGLSDHSSAMLVEFLTLLTRIENVCSLIQSIIIPLLMIADVLGDTH